MGLERAADRLDATATRGRSIAVASGKGGVGKTWFAVTLAHALARLGQRVLLFDGDLGLANVDVQLGLTPAHDLGAVASGALTVAQAASRFEPGGFDPRGFDIVAGRSGSGAPAALDPAATERMLDGLRAAAAGYDTVLLDLGAGLDRSVRRMAAWADTLIVVATDDPTSLTDSYAVMKLHAADRPDGDVRLVVNQAVSRSAGERTYATLRRACGHFLGRTPILAGVVRLDGHVRDAIRRQMPLLTRHPGCPASADVEAVAAGLAAERPW